ncbi:uncharacterized protein LOC117323761 [Pecten maximus]|uniref:uncharacterized protein LOC117323761 n=1 Tax=Pecten maximus TaxID=6579 RepID=UPI001458DD74|nr:uncharacterized protein LOC117323761 [Pecten maximus]
MSTNCMRFTWIDESAPGPAFGYCETHHTQMCAAVIFNSSMVYEPYRCDSHLLALCEYGYDEIDHYFFKKTKVTWNGARDLCSQDGGALATLDTPARFIHSLSLNYNRIVRTGVWIGLYQDSENCSKYTWSNGNPLGWEKWNKGEPKECGEEVCGMLTVGGIGTSNCSNLKEVMCFNDTFVSTSTSSTTSMKTTTKKPTSHYVANMSCECCVRNRTNITQLSRAELQDAITQLRAQLSVSKIDTSVNLRKRISVYESRPSSMAIGGMACVIIGAVIGCIVLPDFIMMCTFLYKLVKSRANKQNAVMPRACSHVHV